MTRSLKFFLTAFLGLAPAIAQSQGLDPAELLKPHTNTWPTYSGDYTGQRYSSLTQIDQSNVKNLSLAFLHRLQTGSQNVPGNPPTIVGGEGKAEFNTPASIRGAILQVNGILDVATPDNAWAVDARDGHELWHFYWRTKGGTHIGNRGMAMWHDRVYMETPDNYLICLDAKTGKEIWHKEIASFALQYFSTMAPIVVGNHLLVGTGDDLDEPGYIQAMDPETGDLQWRFYTVPMKAGDPGLDTWASLDAASHGGGNVWIPGSYDPETHLYIFGTGNPTASYTSQKRGPGDNLYTCSLVAVDVETGKMKWYYQTSPHDTHDFDSAQTPILVDGDFNGKPRKMVLTGARNGYFYTLDRVTGEHLLTGKMSPTINWAFDKLDKNGAPVHIPEKDVSLAGSLVSPAEQGVTNWMPPAYSPQTGLMYIPTTDSYVIDYLTTTDPRGSMGLGGKDEQSLGSMGSYITAMDYKTGKISWQHRFAGVANYGVQNGLRTTAGHLLFGSDPSGNLVAYDPSNGTPLWHAKIGVSNAPETYMLDGHQYVLVGAADQIVAFRLN